MKKNLLGLLLELIGFVLSFFGVILLISTFSNGPFVTSITNLFNSLLSGMGSIVIMAISPYVIIVGLVFLMFGKIICLLADIEYNTRRK